MDEPDSGGGAFLKDPVTAQGLTAPSAERCSPFTWGLKCVPITRKPAGNLCTQHTLLFATAEAQQNAKRRQAQGVSEGIKCEMDSPPNSLLVEVQHRLSAAGTPGSRRGGRCKQAAVAAVGGLADQRLAEEIHFLSDECGLAADAGVRCE